MTEAAVESADVLLKPSDTKSPPSLSPCLPLCSQKGGGECHANIKKQEHCNQVIPKKKFKPKGKLVRSLAFSEESSQFEETKAPPETNIPSGCHDNERTSSRDEEQENSPNPKKPSLSKESSVEYTDSTGTDLDQFIEDTLNSNPRDRLTLLKLEQDMTAFIYSNNPFKKFPQMSSYHRMLVHRVAAYFGMEHNVDHTGKSVIINRTSNTRIPEQRFSDMVHKDKTEETLPLKILLKRDSLDDQVCLCPGQNIFKADVDHGLSLTLFSFFRRLLNWAATIHHARSKVSRWRREKRSTKGHENESSTKSRSALRRAAMQKAGTWRSTIHMSRPRGKDSSSGEVMATPAPAAQAVASRAALRPTIATSTTPHLGAAQTPTPPFSGQVQR